jgi:uncharacterized protein YicC (UPF0701 family)
VSESTKVYRTLADTFEVEDAVEKREVQIIDPVVNVPAESSVERDADAVRDTLYNLLKKGETAFEDLQRIAVAEESPRSFEVLNNMLGQLSDIATKIMDVHEKKQKIQRLNDAKEAQPAINNGTVNNNTVFVGTTADLQEMIKRINME